MGKKNIDRSLAAISVKMAGRSLSKGEIFSIINDISSGNFSSHDIAHFLKSTQQNGMSFKETLWLTEAMAKAGSVLSWGKKVVADKHCIGGIAGNRTTPIVISICAAAGITMPKTSSRAITSAAGTADTMETMANVNLSIKKIKEVVKKAGACIVWGGALSLAPADSIMIKVERALNLDPGPLILSSIFSKKLSAGSTHILIDIPYGKSAKVTKQQALKLKNAFLKMGKAFKKTVRVVLTDGKQPIGNGIGPVLEMFDVLRVLHRDNPPRDLENKSIMLAGNLLEMTNKAKPGQGERYARELLESGLALLAFERIVDAQGRKTLALPAPFTFVVKANMSGKVSDLDNKKLNHLAYSLGCPEYKGAGIYLHRHLGDKVKRGMPIMTLFAQSESFLNKGKAFVRKSRPFALI
jgi:thymidine phosphorylase